MGTSTPQAWLQIDSSLWGINAELGGITRRPTLLVQPCWTEMPDSFCLCQIIINCFVVIYRPMYPPLGGNSIVDIMQEDTDPDWESAPLVLATLFNSLSAPHVYL